MQEFEIEFETSNEFEIDISDKIQEITPPLEDLEVTPSKEQQTFTHNDSYGYDNVKVNPIPEEYIIPEGTLPITENATFDVTPYAKVTTRVFPTPNLQDKSITITNNGTQNIVADDGYDGLNNVEIKTNVSGNKYAPRLLPFTNYSGTELDYEVANLDTKNMQNLKNFFSGCSKLTRLNVSHFDTSNVTSLERTFYSCSSLTELDLSNWDVSKVTTTSYLFYGCTNLTKLNLSNWVETKLTAIKNAGYMFVSCSNLTTLIIDSPAVLKVTTTSFSYSGIETGICTIYVPDNMVATYQADTYWGTYASQIKGMSEYTG